MAERPKMNLEELLSILMDVEALVVVGEFYDATAWASVVEVSGWTQKELDNAIDGRWDRLDFLSNHRVTRGQS